LEKNIEGVQGHLWSETITEDRHMEAMLCPRIIGLSESAWTSATNKRKGSELNALSLNSFRALFKQIGWDYYRSEDFPDTSVQDNINEEGLASEAVH
jgi:hexosaminidase